jgi:hypothetical protein
LKWRRGAIVMEERMIFVMELRGSNDVLGYRLLYRMIFVVELRGGKVFWLTAQNGLCGG